MDDLAMERQKVITWARKGTISDSDLEIQLLALTFRENGPRAALQEKQMLIGNRSERLIELANLLREQVRVGAETINAEPQTPEQAERRLEFKKLIVHAIVNRVDVHKDGTVDVHAEIELPSTIVRTSHPSVGRGYRRFRLGWIQ